MEMIRVVVSNNHWKIGTEGSDFQHKLIEWIRHHTAECRTAQEALHTFKNSITLELTDIDLSSYLPGFHVETTARLELVIEQAITLMMTGYTAANVMTVAFNRLVEAGPRPSPQQVMDMMKLITYGDLVLGVHNQPEREDHITISELQPSQGFFQEICDGLGISGENTRSRDGLIDQLPDIFNLMETVSLVLPAEMITQLALFGSKAALTHDQLAIYKPYSCNTGSVLPSFHLSPKRIEEDLLNERFGSILTQLGAIGPARDETSARRFIDRICEDLQFNPNTVIKGQYQNCSLINLVMAAFVHDTPQTSAATLSPFADFSAAIRERMHQEWGDRAYLPIKMWNRGNPDVEVAASRGSWRSYLKSTLTPFLTDSSVCFIIQQALNSIDSDSAVQVHQMLARVKGKCGELAAKAMVAAEGKFKIWTEGRDYWDIQGASKIVKESLPHLPDLISQDVDGGLTVYEVSVVTDTQVARSKRERDEKKWKGMTVSLRHIYLSPNQKRWPVRIQGRKVEYGNAKKIMELLHDCFAAVASERVPTDTAFTETLLQSRTKYMKARVPLDAVLAVTEDDLSKKADKWNERSIIETGGMLKDLASGSGWHKMVSEAMTVDLATEILQDVANRISDHMSENPGSKSQNLTENWEKLADAFESHCPYGTKSRDWKRKLPKVVRASKTHDLFPPIYTEGSHTMLTRSQTVECEVLADHLSGRIWTVTRGKNLYVPVQMLQTFPCFSGTHILICKMLVNRALSRLEKSQSDGKMAKDWSWRNCLADVGCMCNRVGEWKILHCSCATRVLHTLKEEPCSNCEYEEWNSTTGKLIEDCIRAHFKVFPDRIKSEFRISRSLLMNPQSLKFDHGENQEKIHKESLKKLNIRLSGSALIWQGQSLDEAKTALGCSEEDWVTACRLNLDEEAWDEPTCKAQINGLWDEFQLDGSVFDHFFDPDVVDAASAFQGGNTDVAELKQIFNKLSQHSWFQSAVMDSLISEAYLRTLGMEVKAGKFRVAGIHCSDSVLVRVSYTNFKSGRSHPCRIYDRNGIPSGNFFLNPELAEYKRMTVLTMIALHECLPKPYFDTGRDMAMLELCYNIYQTNSKNLSEFLGAFRFVVETTQSSFFSHKDLAKKVLLKPTEPLTQELIHTVIPANLKRQAICSADVSRCTREQFVKPPKEVEPPKCVCPFTGIELCGEDIHFAANLDVLLNTKLTDLHQAQAVMWRKHVAKQVKFLSDFADNDDLLYHGRRDSDVTIQQARRTCNQITDELLADRKPCQVNALMVRAACHIGSTHVSKSTVEKILTKPLWSESPAQLANTRAMNDHLADEEIRTTFSEQKSKIARKVASDLRTSEVRKSRMFNESTNTENATKGDFNAARSYLQSLTTDAKGDFKQVVDEAISLLHRNDKKDESKEAWVVLKASSQAGFPQPKVDEWSRIISLAYGLGGKAPKFKQGKAHVIFKSRKTALHMAHCARLITLALSPGNARETEEGDVVTIGYSDKGNFKSPQYKRSIVDHVLCRWKDFGGIMMPTAEPMWPIDHYELSEPPTKDNRWDAMTEEQMIDTIIACQCLQADDLSPNQLCEEVASQSNVFAYMVMRPDFEEEVVEVSDCSITQIMVAVLHPPLKDSEIIHTIKDSVFGFVGSVRSVMNVRRKLSKLKNHTTNKSIIKFYGIMKKLSSLPGTLAECMHQMTTSTETSKFSMAPKQQRGGHRPLGIGSLEAVVRMNAHEAFWRDMSKAVKNDILGNPKIKWNLLQRCYEGEPGHLTLSDNVDHKSWGDYNMPVHFCHMVNSLRHIIGDGMATSTNCALIDQGLRQEAPPNGVIEAIGAADYVPVGKERGPENEHTECIILGRTCSACQKLQEKKGRSIRGPGSTSFPNTGMIQGYPHALSGQYGSMQSRAEIKLVKMVYENMWKETWPDLSESASESIRSSDDMLLTWSVKVTETTTESGLNECHMALSEASRLFRMMTNQDESEKSTHSNCYSQIYSLPCHLGSNPPVSIKEAQGGTTHPSADSPKALVEEALSRCNSSTKWGMGPVYRMALYTHNITLGFRVCKLLRGGWNWPGRHSGIPMCLGGIPPLSLQNVLENNPAFTEMQCMKENTSISRVANNICNWTKVEAGQRYKDRLTGVDVNRVRKAHTSPIIKKIKADAKSIREKGEASIKELIDDPRAVHLVTNSSCTLMEVSGIDLASRISDEKIQEALGADKTSTQLLAESTGRKLCICPPHLKKTLLENLSLLRAKSKDYTARKLLGETTLEEDKNRHHPDTAPVLLATSAKARSANFELWTEEDEILTNFHTLVMLGKSTVPPDDILRRNAEFTEKVLKHIPTGKVALIEAQVRMAAKGPPEPKIHHVTSTIRDDSQQLGNYVEEVLFIQHFSDRYRQLSFSHLNSDTLTSDIRTIMNICPDLPATKEELEENILAIKLILQSTKKCKAEAHLPLEVGDHTPGNFICGMLFGCPVNEDVDLFEDEHKELVRCAGNTIIHLLDLGYAHAATLPCQSFFHLDVIAELSRVLDLPAESTAKRDLGVVMASCARKTGNIDLQMALSCLWNGGQVEFEAPRSYSMTSKIGEAKISHIADIGTIIQNEGKVILAFKRPPDRKQHIIKLCERALAYCSGRPDQKSGGKLDSWSPREESGWMEMSGDLISLQGFPSCLVLLGSYCEGWIKNAPLESRPQLLIAEWVGEHLLKVIKAQCIGKPVETVQRLSRGVFKSGSPESEENLTAEDWEVLSRTDHSEWRRVKAERFNQRIFRFQDTILCGATGSFQGYDDGSYPLEVKMVMISLLKRGLFPNGSNIRKAHSPTDRVHLNTVKAPACDGLDAAVTQVLIEVKEVEESLMEEWGGPDGSEMEDEEGEFFEVNTQRGAAETMVLDSLGGECLDDCMSEPWLGADSGLGLWISGLKCKCGMDVLEKGRCTLYYGVRQKNPHVQWSSKITHNPLGSWYQWQTKEGTHIDPIVMATLLLRGSVNGSACIT
uniref:RNA-dependent RNA polymerase n=1 Tax=Beihai bunya-like virus 4 TaxID=1922374 RepID=A0A1L3KPB7_9VIRU|nr:RNA-dependent RNA polymerase [Beihai bunya-like virus 4]